MAVRKYNMQQCNNPSTLLLAIYTKHRKFFRAAAFPIEQSRNITGFYSQVNVKINKPIYLQNGTEYVLDIQQFKSKMAMHTTNNMDLYIATWQIKRIA